MKIIVNMFKLAGKKLIYITNGEDSWKLTPEQAIDLYNQLKWYVEKDLED